MVAVNSTMLPLGTVAPDFNLTDVVSGSAVTVDSVLDGKKGILVMFICRHCPFVKHLEVELANIGRDYADTIGLVGISSNPAEAYPADAPESLKEQAELLGFNFPYCYDADQCVALAYTASCTPDFFVFDADKRLVYRGRLDDSKPRSEEVPDGNEMRAALDALVAGSELPAEQKPSIGCNIKWKEGNAPQWFPG